MAQLVLDIEKIKFKSQKEKAQAKKELLTKDVAKQDALVKSLKAKLDDVMLQKTLKAEEARIKRDQAAKIQMLKDAQEAMNDNKKILGQLSLALKY